MAWNNPQLSKVLGRLSLSKIGWDVRGRGTTGEPVVQTMKDTAGTTWYLFMTTGGTLAISSSLPTADTSAGDTALRRITGTMTSAQLLASFATAIELIPAPGAGKFIQYEYGYLSHPGSVTAYVSGDHTLRYTNISGTTVSATITSSGFTSGAATGAEQRIVRNITTVLEPTVNAPVVFTTASADPTTGNFDIAYDLYYRVVTSKI